MTLQLSEYYRSYELSWEVDPETQARLRRVLTIGLGLLLVFVIVVSFIHLPAPLPSAEVVPQRLARVMLQEHPKPPPVAQPKPVPKPTAKPVPAPKPVDRVAVARNKAQQSGLMKYKDELADLRQDLNLTALAQTRNLQGAVGADSHAERSLITSKVGTASAGITTASASRGFGSGAGSLKGHAVAAVSSRIAAISGDNGPRTTASGKAGRSREEIELVFDRNKGAIDALYGRALREQPGLQGKLLLELTIAPSGEVTNCRIVSSELNDPDLERRIVARVRLFRFEAKDVETMTATKRIDFFPT